MIGNINKGRLVMILEVKKFFVCENREAVFQIEYDKRDHDFITRRPWSIIRGYACTKVGGTPRSMHRLIMKVDDHRIIHHLDGNKLNNRRSNLVICNSAKEHKAYHKKQLGGSEMNCKCSKCGHEWIKRTESDPKMCPSCKSRLWKARANGAQGGRPRQMTAEETALFIEEQSERLCIEHLGYTPATWYQGGPGHNDDRLEAIITADGDIRVTDGGETQIYSGSRTRPAVRRFVKDWLENLWEEV